MSRVLKRNKRYSYKRRVPARYSDFHKGAYIQISLGTSDETTAQIRSRKLDKIIEKYWFDTAGNGVGDPDEQMFRRVIQKAKKRGFDYFPAEDIAAREPLHQILERVHDVTRNDNQNLIPALLGGVSAPQKKIQQALEDFFQRQRDKLVGKTENEIRKWKNPRKKSVSNFIALLGNKPVIDITRADILAFKDWWLDRIVDEGKSPNSANKDLMYLRAVIADYGENARHQNLRALPDAPSELFQKIMLRESDITNRTSFDRDFIQDTLLNVSVLENLNEEARFFIAAMADTGARPGELCGLEADDILLDAAIPHIKIRPNKTRGLKTPQSEREIPLVGSSFAAFQKYKNGFEHYRGRTDSLSTAINKYLRENRIFPSDDHSLYSLRHSFEDRLTAVEPPDKVQAALMGHKYIRPRYGKGPSLEQKYDWLLKIAFDPEGL